MRRLVFSLCFSVCLLSGTGIVNADWKPTGPIKFWIGYGAGGGTDIQARALATEIEKRRGWRIIPENKAGSGGAVMAAALKNEPADGSVIGLAINNTFAFATLTNQNLSIDDFTYITTTSASQMALLARADSGWKSLDDMVAAAKSGTKIVWSNIGSQLQAASEIIAQHYGISVNHLPGKGGKAGVNALVARDANVAWAGGAQRGLVAAGELVILASAEDKPLVQASDGKTLKDYGIDYNFGFQFVLAGPKGMSNEVRDTIADAVIEVLNDPESDTAKFIAKQYPPGPVIIAGDALSARLKENLEANKRLMKAVKK